MWLESDIFMTKSDIRLRLMYLKKYVKISTLAKEFGISQPTLSRFLKNDQFDYQISLDKITNFYNYCLDTLRDFT